MEPELYDRYARLEDAHWWFRARRDVVRACLDRHVGRSGDARAVLDVGCGSGAMLERVLGRYGEACGVDSEARAVAMAIERGVDARHVPGLPHAPLPFRDESFGLVCAFDVLEHVDDDAGLAREMCRVCAPRGAVVVTVPAFPSLWGRQDEVSHHKRRYTSARLAGVLAAADLRIRHRTFFNTVLFGPVVAVRLARRLVGRGALAERSARSDFDTGPSNGVANELLYHLMAAEREPAARFGLPFGVSMLAVCDKR